MEKYMNKQILLQSIKSVSGFMAILAGSLFALGVILSNIPEWLGATLIIVGGFIALVYLDYKFKSERLVAESLKRVTRTNIKD
jgi:hypothetical protein